LTEVRVPATATARSGDGPREHHEYRVHGHGRNRWPNYRNVVPAMRIFMDDLGYGPVAPPGDLEQPRAWFPQIYKLGGGM